MDFDQLGRRIRAETEVHRAVARRSVTDAARHVIVLRASRGNDLDPGAHTVAIALRSFERNVQPMSGAFRTVHPDFRVLAQSRDHHVHAPVTVEIAKGASAVASGRRGVETRFRGQSFPLAGCPGIPKHRVVLFDFVCGRRDRLDMAASNEKILPAVIVKIKEPRSVAGHTAGQLAHAGRIGDLLEALARLVAEQRKGLVVESDEDDIRISVVIEVAKITPMPETNSPDSTSATPFSK